MTKILLSVSKTNQMVVGLNRKTISYPIQVLRVRFSQANQTVKDGAMGNQVVLRDWTSTWMRPTIVIELIPRDKLR